MNTQRFCLLSATFLLSVFSVGVGTLVAQGKAVKIWDRAPHNAFTDLVSFDGGLICVFRESNAHVPRSHQGDGKIRVLQSRDGKTWKSLKLLHRSKIDLRDPKASVMPDGRLMIVAGGSKYDRGKLKGRQPVVAFFEPKTKRWTGLEDIKIDPKRS